MDVDEKDTVQESMNDMLVIQSRISLRDTQKRLRASRWAKKTSTATPRYLEFWFPRVWILTIQVVALYYQRLS